MVQIQNVYTGMMSIFIFTFQFELEVLKLTLLMISIVSIPVDDKVHGSSTVICRLYVFTGGIAFIRISSKINNSKCIIKYVADYS